VKDEKYNLSPIERAVLRVLENSLTGELPEMVGHRIKYCVNDAELYRPILERLVRLGYSKKREGRYFATT